ncbi:MAG: T9SS type A sorting domain-containing protein [Sphingobacteriaceae bacterium]|nr:T9SS type A sorting domain-containing protein [Sphingobacteriaceae bacterium]
MKIKITTSALLVLFTCFEFFSQTGINATLNTYKRKTPIIGFNGNAFRCTSTWTVNTWLDTVKTLNSAMFRYPGGTNANHFDWQTGYWQVAQTTPTWVANLTCTASVKADELLIGLNACQAKALMILNFQHSNVTYQIQGLNYALSKGIAIEHIELGNEHNIPIDTQQYIPATTYATNAKIWADSLKTHFPNSKICLVGGASTNTGSVIHGWHDSIFIKNPNIDALSFHLYMGCGNSDNLFNTKRALSIPFHSSLGVANRFLQGKFTQSVVPSNIEIWVTEYNMSEPLFGTPMQHAGTWTHGLYISALSHLLLKENKITMLIDHNVTAGTEFAAVDVNSNITSSGVAMSILGSASKGQDSTALIDFNSQPSITWSATTYPSLLGWKFWKNSNENAWMVNLSNTTIKVSANQIINGSYNYDTYYGDSALVVTSYKSLNHNSGTSLDSITLPPFSISVLKNQNGTGIQEITKNKTIHIFPNPANNTISFSEPLNNIIVYNIAGEKIVEINGQSKSLSVQDLEDGIYILQSNNNSMKFIVKH